MRRKYFWKSAKGGRVTPLQIWRKEMKVQPKVHPTSRVDKQWLAEIAKLGRTQPRRRHIGYIRCAGGSGKGAFHLWAGAYAGAEND
jgi:hypothetical protein